MLAPPPIILDSTSIDDPLDISSSPIACSYYDRRGSSLTPRQMSESQSNKRPRGRIRSASVFDEGLTGKQVSTQRRPSRAYLLRQKATGEETVVTLLPIQGGPVSGAKTLVTQVPTFVTSGRPVILPRSNVSRQHSLCPTTMLRDVISMANQKKDRSSSMDDQDVCYRSMKSNDNSREGKESSEMIPSAEALEVQRVQKMYSMFRRQAGGASADSHNGSSHNQRLESWLQELESKQRKDKNRMTRSSMKCDKMENSPPRRQSTCISSNVNLNANINSLMPNIEKTQSASNSDSVLKEDDNLLNVISRAQSQQDKIESRFLMPDQNPRRIHRAQSHCPGVDVRSLQKAASRSNRESRSSLSRSPNLYPSTSRRCSEAVAAYAATGDLEMARNLILEARERSVNKSINEDIDDDDPVNCDPPSEKERKNMVMVVSCVGLLITILAATLVGITLGLSHLLEEPDVYSGRNTNVQRQLNMSTNSTSLLESSNIKNGKTSSGIPIVPGSSITKRTKSGGGHLLGSEEMDEKQLKKPGDASETRNLSESTNNELSAEDSQSTQKPIFGLSPSLSSTDDANVPNRKVSSNTNPLPPPLANNNSIITLLT